MRPIVDESVLEPVQHPIAGMPFDGQNGMFKVKSPLRGITLLVQASNGGGWDHVSVSVFGQDRLPTWEEMCHIKNIWWHPEEAVIQIHPPLSDYVDNAECLHLWKCQDKEMPMPGIYMIGVVHEKAD